MSATKLLAGALLAGISIATGEVTVVVTAASIGINWLAEELPGLWPALRQGSQPAPLAAAYAAAIRQAATRLEEDYRRTVDGRSDLAAFKLVAGCAASLSDAEFPPGVASVDTAQRALEEALEPLLHGHDPRQADYLRKHLLLASIVAFQEQLVAQEAAWRAFHGLLLQGLAANSAALMAKLDGFAQVLAAWSDPAVGLAALRGSLARLEASTARIEDTTGETLDVARRIAQMIDELAQRPASGGVTFHNQGMKVGGNVYQAPHQYFGSAHAEGGGTAIVHNTFGAPSPAAPKPVTVLFLAANPSDTQRLRLDREMRAIQKRLQAASDGARFTVEQVWAARRDDVVNGLQRHRPDLVHFAGHGSEEGRLLVEGATGLAEALTPGELRVFLAAVPGIRCVLLNACWSDALANELIQAVDCVAGMPVEVSDSAAIRFAAWFYGSLANGLSVQEAFEVAKAQMLPELGPQGLTDATAPRLRTRPGVDAAAMRFV